jgi:predicted  nucleic acid-binding Zn-ribbon protein
MVRGAPGALDFGSLGHACGLSYGIMPGGAVEALYALSGMEQRAAGLRAQMVTLSVLLEGDPKSSDPRPRLLRAESERKEAARRLKQAEDEEQTERARARSHEQQLYSGRISNPRELSQLATELEHMKVRLNDEEDRELELMAALEQAEQEVAGALAEASTAREQLAGLESQLREVESAIAAQRAATPAADLALFDRVAKFRPPPPVVEVNNGACGGCRIPLSMNQARQLRLSPEPMVCQTCGRILFQS